MTLAHVYQFKTVLIYRR